MASAAQRVNIVVRTKNRPVLLARALDDILAQTFSDWAINLVNDGGESAPVDALVAERAAALGDRITVTHVDGGTGSMEAAANLGAQQGSGEFVVVHDDDDTWHPEFLARTVAALDAQPAAVAVAVRTTIIRERLEGDKVTELSRTTWDPPGDVITLFDMLLTNRVVPISLLVRRSVYETIGWYDPALKAVGDWEFNLRLTRHGHVPFLGDQALAFWHQRPKATGAHSNSIYGSDDEHFNHDRFVRDRALREYVDAHGIGGLLFLTKYIDERMYHHSLLGILGRIKRKIFGRFSRKARS